MPSYGEFIVPPPLDNRPVAEVPATPAGTLCALCCNHNCPTPGACR